MNIRVKKIVINHDALKKIAVGQEKALTHAMRGLRDDIKEAQVVPKETGALEGSRSLTRVDKKTWRLVWSTPYARRQFYGCYPLEGKPWYTYRTDQNPNAKARWTDDWVHGEKKRFLPEVFMQRLKEFSGGVIK